MNSSALSGVTNATRNAVEGQVTCNRSLRLRSTPLSEEK